MRKYMGGLRELDIKVFITLEYELSYKKQTVMLLSYVRWFYNNLPKRLTSGPKCGLLLGNCCFL